MPTPSVPDRILHTHGARLRWRLEGSGPAIALLHGWALDLAYWDPLVPLLAPQFTVLRFDRRGFGLSEGMPDIHRNVDDLSALLQAAGISSAVLVGMSQGARLALHFARHRPDAVRALVLDGAPAFEAEPELPLQQYRRQLESDGLAALRATLLEHPLMQLQRPAPMTQALLAQIIGRYQGLDLLHPVPAAMPPDVTRITASALVLSGSHDSAPRHDAAARLAALLPAVRSVELADAGHLAALDDPPAYAAQVTAFCNSLG